MLILSALVAGVTALVILGPLLGWGSSPAYEAPGAAASAREELLRRRQEILASIKDLDLEYEVGKLTKEDYERAREGFSRQAIEIYRQMDQNAHA